MEACLRMPAFAGPQTVSETRTELFELCRCTMYESGSCRCASLRASCRDCSIQASHLWLIAAVLCCICPGRLSRKNGQAGIWSLPYQRGWTEWSWAEQPGCQVSTLMSAPINCSHSPLACFIFGIGDPANEANVSYNPVQAF